MSLAPGEPMKKDAIVTSILFLMLALGAFVESMKLPFGRVSAPAAGFFPAVLAVLLALASLFAFVEALRGNHEDAVQRRTADVEKNRLDPGIAARLWVCL